MKLIMHKRIIIISIVMLFVGYVLASQSTLPPMLDLTSSKNPVIIIDPAHGGRDAGVSAQGIIEKELTLKAAKLIKKKLENNEAGAVVYLTRENDTFLSAADRVGFANNKKGTIFISIHCDFAESPKAEGYKVYFSSGVQQKDKKDPAAIIDWLEIQSYYIDDSEKLAGYISQYMQEQLIADAGAKNDGNNSALPNAYRKEKSAPIVSLEGVDMPAVEIELGNLNNKNDAGYLKDDKILNAMCYHLKEAIVFFIKNKQ